RLLWQAYATGATMRARLNGQESPAGEFKTALIDDRIAPAVATHADAEGFVDAYAKHIDAMLATLQGERYRIPFLQTLAKKDTASWFDALRAAIVRLHNDRSWIDPTSGKRVSIGLVRMANIAPAIRVARHLARALPQARVACYHSQHLAIQRFHIECRLDFLLRRNDGDAHLWADAEIRALLDAPECTELMLIVVATPVEEIGRDHDFDWAVIDPSSSQSIVQTAGRVNRHRLIQTDKANIAIMQFNWKRVDDPNAKCVFWRPGCETKSAYPSHDLAELLDWATIDHVDARLRFGQHRFAALDDASIEAVTEKPFADMSCNDAGKLLWMAHDTYAETPLREASNLRADFSLCDPEDSGNFTVKRQDARQDAIQIRLATVAPALRAWLALTDLDAVALADEANIPRAQALCASLELYDDGDGFCDMSKIVRDLSFGFYRQP
ncbi:MAG TPA: hypothetical protein VJ001_04270, partial [Rhodocyclaceae bacterium]|nr:hypothetical protein [Rhodocyclaceae bacterium]